MWAIRLSGETRAHRSPSARPAILTVRRLLYSNDSFHSFSSAEFCSAYLTLEAFVGVPVGIESKPNARDYLEGRLPEGEHPSREAVARGRAARKGTRGPGRE